MPVKIILMITLLFTIPFIFDSHAEGVASDNFITTWVVSDNDSINFQGSGTYVIDWGDGTNPESVTGPTSHTYIAAGNYIVTASNGITAFTTHEDSSTSNAQKLRSIDQWGTAQWTTMNSAFRDATNMQYVATDVPNLSGVTDMNNIFRKTNFNADISEWDVSSVTDMNNMFSSSSFNGDISEWDVSSVTDMGSMFFDSKFNGDISEWDVSSVTDMNNMFRGNAVFQQNLGPWYITPTMFTVNERVSTGSIVGEISAQNQILDNQNPVYEITGPDADDFTITDNVLIINNPPSFSTNPSYDITITSTGIFGTNNSRELVIDVVDITPPTIVLTDPNVPQTFEFGSTSPYSDPGAIVTDNDPVYSETVTLVITNSGGATIPAIDSTTPLGTYTLTYSAPDDASGNAPDDASRTVNVVDSIAPVITTTFNISEPFIITPGTTFSIPVTEFFTDASSIARLDFVIDGTPLSESEFNYDVSTQTITAFIPPDTSYDETSATIKVFDISGNPSMLINFKITSLSTGSETPIEFVLSGVAVKEFLSEMSIEKINRVRVNFTNSQNIDVTLKLFASPIASVGGSDPIPGSTNLQQASEYNGQPIQFIGGAVDITGSSSIDNTPLSDVCDPLCDISLTYDDTNLLFPEESLRIYHFNYDILSWEILPTKSHDLTNNIIVGQTSSFSPFTLGMNIPDDISKKKSGGSSSDWKNKPTFGKSWEVTSAQIVQGGFTFNGHTIDITDNFHTDFAKTDSIIGENNHVNIKVYTSKVLKYVTLSLGVPEIGDVSNAETDIIIYLQRNYTNINGYDITEIIHEQKESLINENSTTAVISNVQCSDTSSDEKCYLVGIDFTINAPLKYDVLAITAVDTDRRNTITYINEGVEFIGESLLEPATDHIYTKKVNQHKMETITLTQQDRRYQIWEDENGYLWTQNNYGTWLQITKPDYVRADDPYTTVMNRAHSGFAHLILDEQIKATLVFDSTKIESVPAETFSYDYNAVNRDSSKLERLFDELQIEQAKAQKIIDMINSSQNSTIHQKRDP